MVLKFVSIYGINSIFFYHTPLTYASLQGNIGIVKLLLSQKGIDINCRTIRNEAIYKIQILFFSLEININFFYGI